MICFQRALAATGLDVGGPLRYPTDPVPPSAKAEGTSPAVSVSQSQWAKAKSTPKVDGGSNALLSFVFGIPQQKGNRKSYVASEVGKTGMRVAGVGCEYLPSESLRSQFGAGLKSAREFTEPTEVVGRFPAPSSAPQKNQETGNRFPVISDKYLCLPQAVKFLHTLKTASKIARSCKRNSPFSLCAPEAK